METFTLKLLKQLASGFAAQFGENCEIVIHDLTTDAAGSSIVHIENSHVTGRELGDGPSEAVLNALRCQEREQPLPDKLSYLTKTADGHILRSSTMYIHDESGRKIEYIVSVNYDITVLLQAENALRALTGSSPIRKDEKQRGASSTPDVNTLLDELIEQSVALVGTPAPLMTKQEKIQAINFLNDSGAFLITRSGDKIAKYFGISKYTLYSYVDINSKK